MRMTLVPVIDTECVCKACKKEFIIPEEEMLMDYRCCTWCGSLKWFYKWEWEEKKQESEKRKQQKLKKLLNANR